MAKNKHIQRVHIWDDPESRINFLETTLANKEWEAVVYEPVEDGTKGRLPQLQKDFEKQGYKTSIGVDENGIPTLTLTHFSHETSLLKMVNEFGLAKGISQTLNTGGERLGKVLMRTKGAVDYFMGSEARRFSTLYAFGDLALGSLLKDTAKRLGIMKKDADPTNEHLYDLKKNYTGFAETLFDRGYDLAFLQSAIMMFGVKEGKEVFQSEVEYALDHASKNGLDLSNFDEWSEHIQDRRPAVSKWIENNAIQIGCMTQIIGQLLLVVSGVTRLNKTREFVNDNKGKILDPSGKAIDLTDNLKKAKIGAIGDMVTGSLSVAGWTLMGWFKEQDIENKTPWSEGAITRLSEEIKSSPNKLASACVTLASIVGLGAGGLKFSVQNVLEDKQAWEEFRDNPLIATKSKDIREKSADLAFNNMKESQKGFKINKQIAGNGVYLIGDATVYLTKNRNYEAGQLASVEAMAENATHLIERLPIAMSEGGKDEFVLKLSNHLAQRLESLHDPKNPPAASIIEMKSEERILHYTSQIRNEVISRLPEGREKFKIIIERAADVTLRFGEDQRAEVRAKLAETLAKSNNIAASKEEISTAIDKSIEHKELLVTQKGIKLSKAVMAPDVQKPLAALVKAIPGMHNAQDAIDLYEAVQPFLTRARASDAKSFTEMFDESKKPSHPRVNDTVEAGITVSIG